jgi:hypothetical protein
VEGNPLLLVFFALAAVFTVAIVVLAILQRRMFAEQSRAVREILEEAKRLPLNSAEDEGGDAGPSVEGGN